MISALCLLLALPLGAIQSVVPAPLQSVPGYRVWPSAPTDCLTPMSIEYPGVAFSGRYATYADADTWYPTWASDGNLYSPWTDGRVNGLESVSFKPTATTGNAKIVGDDPMRLRIEDAGMYASDPAPYGGRYPCGSLVHNGIWYYGTYCLMNEAGSLEPLVDVKTQTYNWAVLGPFVGFRISRDFGKTWAQTSHTPARTLFPEPKKQGEPVRIGSPHFVDFGQNMEHSPDGKAYLVAHGAAIPDPHPRLGNASWITGDCIYLLRVTPSPETIDDPSAYEFFAGNDRTGRPVWTRDFEKMRPLLDWNNHCGCVTMTYDAPLRRYLMCVTDGGTTVSSFNTSIFESDRITGPWRAVTHMRKFGQQAYFVNIPSKFISKDGKDFWLCYAANFFGPWKPNPPGGRYGMTLQETRLLSGEHLNRLDQPDNIARIADVTVSSTYQTYTAEGAIDGIVGGFPGDTRQEWASNGEQDSAVLRLNWDKEQRVDRVWLFDRPNNLDQITSGMLLFSDGTTVKTGALPDDAKDGLVVRFPARKVRWLAFFVTSTKEGTPNVGLSEIAVFRASR